MTAVPYTDPGRASFEEIGTYTNEYLLAGHDPVLKPAFAMPLANDSDFPQFAVLGLDADGNLAWATEGDDSGVAAVGALTFSGVAVADETVTVGDRVYTWVAALTDPAVEDEILVGASAAACATNFLAAINGDPAQAGVLYGDGTVPHAEIQARANSATVVGLVAHDPGVAGNALDSTETMTNAAFGAATLTGGLDQAGVKAAYVLAQAAVLGAEGSAYGQVWYSGCFNIDSQSPLVWHASFDTDAKKLAAFRGAPTPTTIITATRTA